MNDTKNSRKSVRWSDRTRALPKKVDSSLSEQGSGYEGVNDKKSQDYVKLGILPSIPD